MIHRDKMPQDIETERLLLRQPTFDDALFFYELTNSPGWIRFIGDRNIDNQEVAQKYIDEHYLKAFVKNGFGIYFITLKENRQTVGICGLLRRDELPAKDLGFAMLPEFEGKGIAYEAANAVISHFFSAIPNENLLAITTTDNEKSAGLLQKLGFIKVKDVFVNTGTATEKFILYALQMI